MKILYIVDKYPIPGEPKRDKYPLIYKRMVDRGHTVCMIAHSALYRNTGKIIPEIMHINNDSKNESFVYEARLHRFIEHILKYPMKIFRVKELLEKLLLPIYVKQSVNIAKKYIERYGAPDVIHAWGELPLAINIAVELKKEYSIPIVLNFHSDRIYYNKEDKSGIIPKLKYVDVFAPVSQSLLDLWVEKYNNNLPQKKVVIGNPVDDQKFSLSSRERVNNEIVIFHISKLYESKNVPLLIGAFSRNFKGKSAILKLGGKRKIPYHIKETIKDYGIEKQIEFVGTLTPQEVSETLNHSDIYIQSTVYETYGIPVAEALMTGTPVVTTKSGGPESLVKSFCGKISEGNDLESFSKSLKSAAENIHKYNPERIRNYAINEFSIDSICEKMEKVYYEIIKH